MRVSSFMKNMNLFMLVSFVRITFYVKNYKYFGGTKFRCYLQAARIFTNVINNDNNYMSFNY